MNKLSTEKSENLSLELQVLKEEIESSIDDHLKQMGINDPSEFTDEDGWRYFKMGSAQGFAYVDVSDEDLYFTTGAIVMPLPADKGMDNLQSILT